MTLIGETANCLLRHSVQRCVKNRTWVRAHARNHAICESWPKTYYCSRSCRRRFTVLNFKSWAYSGTYGNFQQHLYCACAETLFMNFRCKFRHRRSIRRPRFPIRVQNFGDLATFSADFCILYAECPLYCLTDWPRKYTTRVDPHASIIIT